MTAGEFSELTEKIGKDLSEKYSHGGTVEDAIKRVMEDYQLWEEWPDKVWLEQQVRYIAAHMDFLGHASNYWRNLHRLHQPKRTPGVHTPKGRE